MARTALVLGASGLVGSHLVDHLARDARYERVVCLLRRPLGARADKTEERIVDFTKLSADDIPAESDLFCAIGTTMKKAGGRDAFRWVDHDLPLRVAELAVARGSKRMALVSSVGASSSSSTFYLKTKGELEDALARLPFAALHIFRPSLLLGDRSEKRTGETIASVAMRVTAPLLAFGLRKYRAIDSDLVARAMVAAIVREDPRPARRVYEHDEMLTLTALG